MPCNTLIDPACLAGRVVQSVTAGAAGDVLGAIAQAIGNGVAWIVRNTAAWWIQIPSPDLVAEPAVGHLQQWLLPVTAAVAVAGVIAAGARMAIARKANPLLDVTGGLLALAAAITLGTVVPALLLKAGDAWSAWVLQASTSGQFTQRLAQTLTLGNDAAPAVVLIFGLAAIVLSVIQAALMLFRQAALIILAGVLPLAAAGAVAPMTRTWIRKVTSWMLALIFYKPAAAAVYATAFTMTGSGGSLQTVLMGFVMLLLSVLALPALMKFFTWTTGTIAGSGGGGQLLNAAAVGAIALGSMRSSPGSGSAAQDQAAFMNSRLGTPPGSSPGGSSPGPADGPAGGPADPSAPSTAGGASPADPGSTRTSGAPAAAPGGGPPSNPGPTGEAGAPTGAADAAVGGASAGSPTRASGSASGATPAGAAATRGAAGAGPAGAAAAAAQAGSAAAHLAGGAMEPEDQA